MLFQSQAMCDALLELSRGVGQALATMQILQRKIEALTVFAEQADGSVHATNPLWPRALGTGRTNAEALEALLAEIAREETE